MFSTTSTPARPKLVLVTGADGLVGSSLVKSLLERRYAVRGTVREDTRGPCAPYPVWPTRREFGP